MAVERCIAPPSGVHFDAATAAVAVDAKHATVLQTNRNLSVEETLTQEDAHDLAKSASDSAIASKTIQNQNLLLRTESDTNSQHHNLTKANETNEMANISTEARKDQDSILGEPTQEIDGVARNFLTNDELPYVTSSSLPGIGGRLKAKEHHFVVTEIPLFECDNKIDR